MTTKTMTLDEAEAKAAEAAERYDQLQADLADGDLSVTAKKLANAREEAEYAALAVQGVKANEARADEEQRRDKAAQFAEITRTEVGRTADGLDAAIAGFEEAVAGLFDAAEAHNETVGELRSDLNLIVPPDAPKDDMGRTVLPDYVREVSDRGWPKIGRTRVVSVDPLALAAALLGQAGKGRRADATTSRDLRRLGDTDAANARAVIAATTTTEDNEDE